MDASELKIRWGLRQPKYGPIVHTATIGMWTVGSVSQGIEAKGYDGPRETARCALPGIKEIQGKYDTVDEAKSRVESVVAYWFNHLKEG